MGLTLLPVGGRARVCLGQALVELDIRLVAVGLLGRLRLPLGTALSGSVAAADFQPVAPWGAVDVRWPAVACWDGWLCSGSFHATSDSLVPTPAAHSHS